MRGPYHLAWDRFLVVHGYLGQASSLPNFLGLSLLRFPHCHRSPGITAGHTPHLALPGFWPSCCSSKYFSPRAIALASTLKRLTMENKPKANLPEISSDSHRLNCISSFRGLKADICTAGLPTCLRETHLWELLRDFAFSCSLPL